MPRSSGSPARWGGPSRSLGLRDVLFGRKKLKDPARERLFAISTARITLESERFPDSFPKDPADRLIAATARVHDLTLLTADASLRAQAQVRALW